MGRQLLLWWTVHCTTGGPFVCDKCGLRKNRGHLGGATYRQDALGHTTLEVGPWQLRE